MVEREVELALKLCCAKGTKPAELEATEDRELTMTTLETKRQAMVEAGAAARAAGQVAGSACPEGCGTLYTAYAYAYKQYSVAYAAYAAAYAEQEAA